MRYVRYILSMLMAPDFNIKCNKCTKCCEMKRIYIIKFITLIWITSSTFNSLDSFYSIFWFNKLDLIAKKIFLLL